MGLDIYARFSATPLPEDPPEDFIDDDAMVINPSKIDPDHLFQLGMFTSSYHETSFNAIARDNGLRDLYAIFLGADTDRRDQPDVGTEWNVVRHRVKQDLRKYERGRDLFRITRLDLDATTAEKLDKHKSLEQTTEIMKERFDSAPADMRSFSRWTDSGPQLVVLDGMDVVKVEIGFAKCVIRGNLPSVFVTYRTSDENRQWMINAYRILLEFVDLAEELERDSETGQKVRLSFSY